MPSSTVEADLILPSMRVRGLLSVDESERISDVFNTPHENLLLKDIVVRTLEGTRIESFPELTIEKRHVLAVVPLESADYVSSRRLTRFGVTRPTLLSLAVGIVLPPFSGQGILFLPPPLTLPIALARLSHFFALLNADLYLNRVPVVESTTLLVNRELVVGLGPLEETGSAPRSGLSLGTASSEGSASGANEALTERLWREVGGSQYGQSPTAT